MKREWEPGRGCGRPSGDAAAGRRIVGMIPHHGEKLAVTSLA